jgi:hypothetical protein
VHLARGAVDGHLVLEVSGSGSSHKPCGTRRQYWSVSVRDKGDRRQPCAVT